MAVTQLTQAMMDKHLLDTGHSLFGPSSMKRRMVCSASALEECLHPDLTTTEAAELGTHRHTLSEESLGWAIKAGDPFLATGYIWDQDWDWEDKAVVVAGVSQVLSIVEEHRQAGYEPTIMLEKDGSLSSWGVSEVEGTADVVIASPFRIDVLDYKYGRGYVSAQDNPQCKCYLGCTVPYPGGDVVVDVEHMPEMNVHITQPRIDNFDRQTLDWIELCRFILGDVADAVRLCLVDSPTYTVDKDACFFCDGRYTCEARLGTFEGHRTLVEDASKNPDSVAKAMWESIHASADVLRGFIKDAESYGSRELRSGRGFTGFKFVAGRGSRSFIDALKGVAYIKEKLGDKAFKTKEPPVITLAQAEKVLPALKKDEEWKALIEKKSGAPTMVAESDPREAVHFGQTNWDAEAAASVVVAEPDFGSNLTFTPITDKTDPITIIE